jgi:arginine N-succinyltransferase
MHLIRRARNADVDILLKLAKMVHFINLPADKDIIAEKIHRSRESFRAVHEGLPLSVDVNDKSAVGNSPLFMFIIEDTESGNTLGTCMIIARMGGPGVPNISFELSKKHFFSEDLQQGTSHTVATLVLDESGPTEIGGLILAPSARRHARKLGKQISLIRFHYIGLRRAIFADRILAEMMAPITPDGRNTLWEYLGRRFINLPYTEADKFCQRSREFMTSLLPREPIYLSLLPPEARNLVGRVGPDTEPARAMLEALGFRYTNRIDPFDGGPHLEALTDQIPLVRETSRTRYEGPCTPEQVEKGGFVSVEFEDGTFHAAYAGYRRSGDGATIEVEREWAELLELQPGYEVGVTPLDLKLRPAGRAKRPAPATA